MTRHISPTPSDPQGADSRPRGAGRLALALSALLLCTAARAEAVFPGATWETRTPAEMGADAAALAAFSATTGGDGVVVKDGYLIHTWGDPDQSGDWASATKPLYSTLLLFALQEGAVGSVEDTLPLYGWVLPPEDQDLRLRDLADNVSGYALTEGPGEAFAYNDYAIKLYWTTLLEQVYGADVDDASAVEDLFRDPARLGPLRFEAGSIFRQHNGVVRADMSPKDFARIGWLWLNRGAWDGTALLSQTLFDTYTQPGVPAGLPSTAGLKDPDYLGVGTVGGGRDQSALGPGVYGFNWWFNTGGALFPDAPDDTYQANGHWNGEVVTVMPSLGVVAAWRGGDREDPDTWNDPMNDTLAALVLPEPGRGAGVLAGALALAALRRLRARLL